jgi:excisionase family DNA binding protein
MTGKLLLGIREVSEQLGCGTAFVGKLVRSGELPALTLAGRVKVRSSAVTAFIEQRSEEAASRNQIARLVQPQRRMPPVVRWAELVKDDKKTTTTDMNATGGSRPQPTTPKQPHRLPGEAELLAAARRRLRPRKGITVLFKRQNGQLSLDRNGQPIVRAFRAQVLMPDGRQVQQERRILGEATAALDDLFVTRTTWRREIRDGLRDPQGGQIGGTMTFDDASQRYLQRPTRPQTRELNRATLEHHVWPFIGGTPLRSLNDTVLTQLFEDMLRSHLQPDGSPTLDRLGRPRRGLGVAAQRSAFKLVTAILNFAVKQGWLSGKNPAMAVTLPRYTPRPMRAWDFNEAVRFENHVRTSPLKQTSRTWWPEAMYALVTIQLQIGARIGETLALTWDNIDFVDRSVHLQGTVIRLHGLQIQWALKTTSGNAVGRDIPMPNGVYEALVHWRAAWEAIRRTKDMAIAYEERGGLVFPNLRGGITDTSTIRALAITLMKGAGVPIIRLHEMRATMISHALEARVNTHTIAAIVGHSSPFLIDRTYGKVIASRRRATADAMNAIRQHYNDQTMVPRGPIEIFLAAVDALADGIARDGLNVSRHGDDFARLAELEARADVVVGTLPLSDPTLARFDAAVGLLARVRRAVDEPHETPEQPRAFQGTPMSETAVNELPPPFILLSRPTPRRDAV